MTPPESHESDPFNTRPSLPLGNFQTDWPGLDLSAPYPAAIDSPPPPPPPTSGKIILVPERRRWLHSAQALAIGLLSLAVIVLSLVILSFHQGGIVGFFSNSTSSSTTNVQNTTATSNTTSATSIASGTGGTATTPPNPVATATIVAVVASPTNSTATVSTPTVVAPTATMTSVPAPTVTFTCQSVSGGQGTPGPKNMTQICVQTSPYAHVTIAATKCDSTPDNNLKQTSGTADGAGDFQWSWTMQDPGPCDQEHITVTAQTSSGQTGQNAVYLQFIH